MKKHLLALFIIALSALAASAGQIFVQDILQSAPKEAEPQGATRLLTIRGGIIRQMAYSSVKGAGTFAALGGNPTDNPLMFALLNSKVTAGSIGTAAAKNAPSTGNALAAEVVMGDDTRLTDARTPLTHTQAASSITEDAAHRFATDTEKAAWNGKQPAGSYLTSSSAIAFGQITSAIKGKTLNVGQLDIPAGPTAQVVELAQPSTVGTHKGIITVDDNLTTDPVLKLTDSGVMFNGSPIVGAPAPDSSFVSTAPTYRDVPPCTRGQWSTDGVNHYDCTATNTWEIVAYGADLPMAPAAAAINDTVKVTGILANSQMTPTPGNDTANSYLYYSPVTAGATGTVSYAHWNMYSSGTPNPSTSKFMVYNTAGVLVCSSAAVSGDGNTTSPGQLINAALTGCNLTSGTSYLVGVCAVADGSFYNAPYYTNTTSGPVTNRVQVACDGSSFTPASATQISATRPIYAWGDNSATR